MITARATERVTRVTKAAATSKNNIANLRHGRVPLHVAVRWAVQTSALPSPTWAAPSWPGLVLGLRPRRLELRSCRLGQRPNGSGCALADLGCAFVAAVCAVRARGSGFKTQQSNSKKQWRRQRQRQRQRRGRRQRQRQRKRKRQRWKRGRQGKRKSGGGSSSGTSKKVLIYVLSDFQ